MPSDETFTITDAVCVGETASAILVEAPFFEDVEGSAEVWIPQSVVHDDSEVYTEGTDGELVIHYWFAQKKGWV